MLYSRTDSCGVQNASQEDIYGLYKMQEDCVGKANLPEMRREDDRTFYRIRGRTRPGEVRDCKKTGDKRKGQIRPKG